MSKFFRKKVFKVTLFWLIGILIWIILQSIFIPKRFPYDKSNDTGKMRYYLGEEKNNIDVLILGTSHPARGILPMEMYELYGIKSYNLATSTQPIQVTYYALREAMKTQKPKVVIWDIANLYINYTEPSRWKMMMDEMKIGKNKALLAEEYLKNFNDMGETIFDLVLPLMEYHIRWKELTGQDFNLVKSNKHYFGKGGQINSMVSGGISVDDMNSIANGLLQNTKSEVYEYNGKNFNEFHEDDILYHVDVSDANIEWLLKIKELCDANNIHLLAVKVPSVFTPQQYASTWTMEKSNKTRMVCKEHGIEYYDLLYDTDLALDFEKDTNDSGLHLNLYGAKKVSANLGNYLNGHYELSNEHNEQWDKDLMSYQKTCKVAWLELEQDFSTYINMLANEYKDNTVFIAASDEMSQGLNEADINSLRALGMQTDYSRALQQSYIAVIENGEVKYEALSNRPLNYTGVCSKSSKKYELYSSGWWTGSYASIKLDGYEYAVDADRGLNIVVYDDERGLILDSVNFATYAEHHTPVRRFEMINHMEEEFERYIMEVEDG